MTTISKTLAVFAAVAAVAFMGFAAVTVVGGPNWEAEMAASDIGEDYVFEKAVSADGKVTWSAKVRRTQEAIPVSKPGVAASAVIAVRQKVANDQKSQLQRIEKLLPSLETGTKQAQTLMAADQVAMKKRLDEMTAELKSIQQQLDAASKKFVKKASETQSKQTEAANRREDVFRLQAEYNEIRTDRDRILRMTKELEKRLIRLNGDVARLERRNQQLMKAGATLPGNAGATSAESP